MGCCPHKGISAVGLGLWTNQSTLGISHTRSGLVSWIICRYTSQPTRMWPISDQSMTVCEGLNCGWGAEGQGVAPTSTTYTSTSSGYLEAPVGLVNGCACAPRERCCAGPPPNVRIADTCPRGYASSSRGRRLRILEHQIRRSDVIKREASTRSPRRNVCGEEEPVRKGLAQYYYNHPSYEFANLPAGDLGPVLSRVYDRLFAESDVRLLLQKESSMSPTSSL